MVDEYLARRVVSGQWPEEVPDGEDLLLPTSRHWRILQSLHGERRGRLAQLLDSLSPAGRDGLRYPHPEVLQILDPRTLLDEAAQLGERFGGGWLIDESLATGLHHGRALWFGKERNVGRTLQVAADELGIAVHIAP